MSTARRPRCACSGLAALVAGPLIGVLLVADGRAQSLEQHDSSLPIEITADSLEVLQDQKIATFAGNVDAVQGDLVLSADQLRVHYGDDGTAAAYVDAIFAMPEMQTWIEGAKGEMAVSQG